MKKIKKNNINLYDTITCGQIFRYEVNNNEYILILEDRVVKLIEDDNYSSLEDVKKWKSPHTSLTGDWLYKAMTTMQNKKTEYDVEFRFCKKAETGEQIIKILMKGGM